MALYGMYRGRGNKGETVRNSTPDWTRVRVVATYLCERIIAESTRHAAQRGLGSGQGLVIDLANLRSGNRAAPPVAQGRPGPGALEFHMRLGLEST